MAASTDSGPKFRVIALTGDSLEALRILDAQGLVVGVNDTIIKEPLFWGELAGLPVVGSWNEPNYEKIYSLRPDLVLTYKDYPGPELEKKLQGIKILRLDLYKPSTMFKEMKTLAKILHKKQEAKKFIRWYQNKLNHIRAKISKSSSSPRVYMECYSAYHALGPGSGGYQMCELAGGDSISSEFSIPYPQITSEWVLNKQPEVIVKTASINGYIGTSKKLMKKARQEIIDRPGWKDIKAIKDNRIHVLTSDIDTGPRAIVGIAYMAKWFYPQKYSTLQPMQIHKQYLKKFQEVKYRGCYAWPPVNSGQ